MHRVIILGASNVTLGFPTIVRELRKMVGPVELLAAHGHGRSYGMGSRVLCRALPSIRSCRLWEDLDQRSPAAQPPLALITDVGNDVLYGASVEQILQWVETCLLRLSDSGARVTVATLPLGSLRRLGAMRYRLTKTFFFPGQGPNWEKMQEIVPLLDDGLRRLAAARGAAIVCPRDEWYGFDPIHIRRSFRRTAWHEILNTWPDITLTADPPTPQRIASLTLWRLRPALRTVCGLKQEAPQPALRLRDGGSISIY